MFSAYFWLYFFAAIVPVLALWLAWEIRKSELLDSEVTYRKVVKNASAVLACAIGMSGLNGGFSLLPEPLQWLVGISFLILLVFCLHAWGQIVGILRHDSHSAVLPHRG